MSEEGKSVVFYVEDNLANLRLMERIFATLDNLELASAAGVSEAKEKLESLNPSLLLIDIDLPDGNGIDLLKQLREKSHLENVLAFAISANATKHDIDSGLEGGFDKYITKPINVVEFCDMLKYYLG